MRKNIVDPLDPEYKEEATSLKAAIVYAVPEAKDAEFIYELDDSGKLGINTSRMSPDIAAKIKKVLA